ncbi:MAG: hypothetical protein JWO07_871 [Candidatus Saccharibacteria bacterium]|nr:hypothetical protein [Candidatus Saccharibacteria bacterium]
MLLVTELLKWWYTAGLRQRAQKVSLRLDGTIDYFSMDLLIKTLFSPFRQISAGKVDGSLEVQLRAVVDKLFSRVIGAVVRIILLVVGCVTIALQIVLAVVVMILWVFVPLMPLIGLGLSVAGVKL